MSGNFQQLITFVIPPGGSHLFDINIGAEGIKNFRFDIKCTYANSAATTGVSGTIYDGVGGPDSSCLIGQPPFNFALPCVDGGSSVPDYGDNGIPINFAPFTPSVPQTVRTYGYLNQVLNAHPDWVRFKLTNLDPVNNVTVVMTACIF